MSAQPEEAEVLVVAVDAESAEAAAGSIPARDSVLERTVVFGEVLDEDLKEQSSFWTTLTAAHYSFSIVKHVRDDYCNLYVECSDLSSVGELMRRNFGNKEPKAAKRTVDEVQTDMLVSRDQQIAQMTVDATELNDRYAYLESHVTALSVEITTTARERDQAVAALAAEKEKHESTAAALAAEKAKSEKLATELAQVSVTVATLQQELAKLRATVQSTHAQLSEAQASNTRVDSEMKMLQTELQDRVTMADVLKFVANEVKLSPKCAHPAAQITGLTATFGPKGANPRVVQATRPLMPIPGLSRALGYYEVTIRNEGDDRTIGVGLAAAGYWEQEGQPGWSPDSIGFHGDDGLCWFNSNSQPCLADGFHTGDVIGVAWLMDTHKVIFTKNGEKVASFDGPNQTLLPTVGCQSSNASWTFNFGDTPFRCNVRSLRS